MINTQSETIFPLRETPDHLPKRNGRKCHLASIYRWKQCGLSGVRLETIYIGGTQYTSKEALERFFQRVTAVKPASHRRHLRTNNVKQLMSALCESSKMQASSCG